MLVLLGRKERDRIVSRGFTPGQMLAILHEVEQSAGRSKEFHRQGISDQTVAILRLQSPSQSPWRKNTVRSAQKSLRITVELSQGKWYITVRIRGT